jgi:hypothetical protein
MSFINADSNRAMVVFMQAMQSKNATSTDSFEVLNTDALMQNNDYTTGYVFGYWGTGR